MQPYRVFELETLFLRRRATVAHVRPGEQQPEVDHQFKGENTNTGNFQDRGWRDARDGEWFSYSLKVEPDTATKLLCTYWGSDAGNRNFDIMVDGQIVGSETLNDNKPGEFFNSTYAIPADLLKGKSKVEVEFQAKPGAMAGGLFDCRTIR